MNKFILLLLVIAPYTAITQSTEPQDIAKEISRFIIDKDYEAITSYVRESDKEKLNPNMLEKTFQSLASTYGKVDSALDFCAVKIAEGDFYRQGLHLEKQKFDLIFSLNEDHQLSQFRIAGYTDKSVWEAPDYVNFDQFTTEDIRIGEENPLLGEYTKAKAEKDVILVFVHGSGPNNMNERLGPNELFKDLSYGLASQGISSIRYNKRVYDYPAASRKMINSITIDEEVVTDAVAAIQKAKSLGANKVILLGHSLGGHLAPKIADQIEVDGVIIMAGNASPIVDLLVPQFEHIMSNDSSSGITDFQLNTIKYQVNTVKEKKYDANSSVMTLPLGMNGNYWLSLQDYNPVKLAKKHKFPYLILNGDRDYQVTPEEAKKWKNGSKNDLSKTIIYPKLNHMFFEGEGICIPSEYEKLGHLNSVVLEDMIKWISKL